MTQSTPEKIWARNIREGDTVQHYLQRWPAQTVTRIDRHGDKLTFTLSGGRAVNVPEFVTFLRYNR